ncbi:MAG: SUMF1/EgtB/PvdO family nonheme iron enzyme, partial [Bacteroidaceae bacterium]|nr:SUMF1/EgtB/PvdO family nonheme iron enzyme [Bacteroidaceae bacterium]
MTRIDSLHIDSLKSCMHADSVNIDSLNDIIKANTAVFDSNTANNISAVDSLTNHIQICQNQIDSIGAHSDPLKHIDNASQQISLLLDKICQLIPLQELQEMDLLNKALHVYLAYFVCVFIIFWLVRLLIRSCNERYNKLSLLNGKWINKGISYKPKNLWLLVIKWLLTIVFFIPLLPFYYVFFIKQIFEYFAPFKGNKIKLHRDLYSKGGIPLLWFSAKVAFFVPLTLCIIVTIVSWFTSNPKIYVRNFGDSSDNNVYAFWQIFCQYLDPGNIGNSQGADSAIALISALFGIVCLSGFLVSAIVNVISQTRIQWQKGLINYNGVKKFKDYVVIIGINEQTASIARRALDSDDKRYVLIQTRQDVEKVRPELESKIDDNIQDRIVYYAGDRTSYEDIEKLHLEKAIEVYILGESVENTNKRNSDDQLEKEHDAYNISCLEHISKYIGDCGDNLKSNKKNKKSYEKWKARPRLNVHVQFDYQSTFTAFKATHLYQKLGRNIRFIPFNIHELWAKKVLVDNLAIYPAGNKTELKVQRYYPIDTYVDENDYDKRKGITVNCEKTVHLVILGMNQMGTALATQAALLCHFPNFANDKTKKTTITFIDDKAIDEANYYMGRYANLFALSKYKLLMPGGNGELFDPDESPSQNQDGANNNQQLLKHLTKDDDKGCLLDVEWEFVNGDSASIAVQKHIKKIAEDKNKIVTIAICFNDSQQSLAAAMYLPKTVYDNCNQVLVYQRSIFDVAKDVATGDSDWRRYKNLFPFGMSEASYTENPFDSHLAALDYYLYENEERCKLIEKYFDSDKKKEQVNDKEKEQEEKYKRKTFENSFLKDVDDAWENAGIVRKTASIDSVDSIPFKLRSMGIEYCRDLDKIKTRINKKKYRKIKDRLVEAEHNRWMMQRLISGFRHLSETEQKEIYDKREEPSKYKRLIEEIKEEERASYYICSFKRMVELDKRMVELEKEGNENDHMSSKDESVIKMIPILLRGQELLNVLILTSNDERYKHSQRKTILKKIFEGKFLRIEGRKEECKEEDKVYCEHAFRMADTAVSRKQWQFVTGEQVSGDAKLPVVSVSKNEVEDFLAILRKKSGLYFDLPSIKEWQTAADSDFANNVTKDNKKNAKKWNCKHSKNKKVKLKPVIKNITDKKLHHFFGNVWEWTHKMDEHGKGLYKFVGGSFRFGEKECSPAIDPDNNYWCHSWDADSKSDDLGFRLVWKYDRVFLSVDANFKKEESKAKTQKNEMHEAIEKWFEGETHKFVRVDSGYFVMGADKNPNGDLSKEPDDNEGHRHTVHISEPFYICKVPVTQSLWNAVM